MSMYISDELATVLGGEIFTSLDRFFNIASANGVRNVTLDCTTRKVHVEMHQVVADEGTDYESYFQSMMESCNMEGNAKAIFVHWRRVMTHKQTFARYQKCIGRQLEDLLKSDFLIPDEWVLPEEIAFYTGELQQWGLTGDCYVLRYCQLRDFLILENGRFEVDPAAAGKYLQMQNEKLTRSAIKRFFCFLHLCRLIYAAMDGLEGGTDTLSSGDEALRRRILDYVENGDWRMPATHQNVRKFLSELFKNIEFRDFFKMGKAGADTDRVEVSMANILGYLMEHQLLNGGQKQISKDFFGDDAQVNNINKGKQGNGSQAFKNLIPLMDKYRERVIV